MQLPVCIELDRRSLISRLLVRRDVAALTLHADGRCKVVHADGKCMEVSINPALTVVFPWLVVLHYRAPGMRGSLVLPAAAVGNEGHRRLRVWLRWGTIDPAKRHASA